MNETNQKINKKTNGLEYLFYLVHRHKDFDQILYEKVIKQDAALVINSATPDAKKLYSMQKRVERLIHLKKGFMRLETTDKGILYAKTELEHDVIDLLLIHFHHRFPIMHIAIGTKNKTHIISNKGQINIYEMPLIETIKKIEQTLPQNQIIHDIQTIDEKDNEIWKNYYDSQYIKERRNIRLMTKMMPYKYRDQNSIETAMAKRTKTLTELFSEI